MVSSISSRQQTTGVRRWRRRVRKWYKNRFWWRRRRLSGARIRSLPVTATKKKKTSAVQTTQPGLENAATLELTVSRDKLESLLIAPMFGGDINPAYLPSPVAQNAVKSALDQTSSAIIGRPTEPHSIRRKPVARTATSHLLLQKDPLAEEKAPAQRLSLEIHCQSYADGFHENPLIGSPASNEPQSDKKVGVASSPPQVIVTAAEDSSQHAGKSSEGWVESLAQSLPAKKELEPMARRLSEETSIVRPTYKQRDLDQVLRETPDFHARSPIPNVGSQLAVHPQVTVDAPTSLTSGSKDTTESHAQPPTTRSRARLVLQPPANLDVLTLPQTGSKETRKHPMISTPPSRDTQNIAMDVGFKAQDTRKIALATTGQHNPAKTSPITSRDRFKPPVPSSLTPGVNHTVGNRRRSLRSSVSHESFLSRSQPSAKVQRSKSFIPTFLKPGAKIARQPIRERDDLYGYCELLPSMSYEPDINLMSGQGEARIPAYLRDGWGEAPRSAPKGDQTEVSTKHTSRLNPHHYEMHLPVSSSDKDKSSPALASNKSKSTRRNWGLPWIKRSRRAEQPADAELTASATEKPLPPVTSNAELPVCQPTPARVVLAQSGPASIVIAPVFPPSIMVKPASDKSTRGGHTKRKVSNIPPTLRIGHKGPTVDGAQEDSPTYKWPLVNFTDELFVNFDPKTVSVQPGRGHNLKHQQPRIVSMQFSDEHLSEQVLKDLAKQEEEGRFIISPDTLWPEVSSELESPVSPSSNPSPTSTMDEEMTASHREFTKGKAKEVHISPPPTAKPSESEMVQIQSSTPPINMGKSALDSVMSLAHESTEDDEADFTGFPFSRADYEDPADKHCRSYRDRRRELRKLRHKAWLAELDKDENEEKGTEEEENDTGESRGPEESWLAL